MRYDTVVIGGGKAGTAIARALASSGRKCAMICFGRSISGENPEIKGVDLLLGDKAIDSETADGKALCVLTRNGLMLEADNFVLATGKFFSGGLVTDMEGVYEPVFGADVRSEPSREDWFNPIFEGPQPFLDFGVKTDSEGRILVGGKALSNVYAAGEILDGVNAANPEFDCETIIETLLCKK